MIQAIFLIFWLVAFPQAWVPRVGPWILRWVAWERAGVLLDSRRMDWEFEKVGPWQRSVNLRLAQVFARDRGGRWRGEALQMNIQLIYGFSGSGFSGGRSVPGGGIRSWIPALLGWKVEFQKGQVDLGRTGQIQASGAWHQPIRDARTSMNLQAQWKSALNSQQISLNLSASGTRDQMKGAGKLEARGLSRWVPKVTAQGCQFRVERVGMSDASHGSKAELECPLRAWASLENWEGAPAPLRSALFPVKVNLKAGVGMENGSFHLLRVQARNFLAKVAGLELTGQADWVSGARLLRFQARASSSDLGLWVSACEREACEVPAPFHVLRGPWHLAAEGEWRPRSGLGLRLDGATHWEGAGQRLNAELAGTWQTTSSGAGPDGQFEVRLRQLRLALPPISILSPPRILSDRRIRRGFRNESPRIRAGSVEPSWVVRLGKKEPSDPVEVLSNLGRSAIGVRPRLEIHPGGALQGVIDLDSFPLSWMRRDAQVEQFRFELNPHRPDVPIQGKVKFFTADYRVDLRVSGSLEEPEIHLESEPAVPEEQLWSVLLFGRTFDDLDSWETESVGDTRAAVADRALSLAALYLLTATPVEGMTYDPSSGAVGLRLKLGQGASLRLGTNAEQRAVWGLRKRVGRSWTLIGGVGEDRPGVGQALLEWSRRY